MVSNTSATDQAGLARRTLQRLDRSLPVRPGPLLDLLACKGDCPKEVTKIVERDPVMSARVLGVVNSAGNRVFHEIATVPRAVLQLGAKQVRTLGLAVGLQMLAEDMGLPDATVRQFWNNSLYKAEAAMLAAAAIDRRAASSAYTLGLIADLGLPLLMAIEPEFYEQAMHLRPAVRDWCETERERFGIDHAEAAAHVLNVWGVSAQTCRLVRNHHQLPDEAGDAGTTLSLFVAGLLPHDDGEMAPKDLDRFMAVHAKVLSHAFVTPDAFLGQVYLDASKRMGQDPGRDKTAELKAKPFIDAIASNTIHLVTQLTAMQEDRSNKKRDLSNLRFEAFTDPLTKLLNRRGFFGLAEQRIEKHGQPLGVCCMLLDLNKFKPINDQYGHEAGDLVLRGAAKLLRRSLARHDIIARLGGDEFIVLITDIDEHDARVAATRLRDNCLDKRILVSPNNEIKLSFCVGAVYHPRVGQDVKLDQLLAAADELMYQRKRSGQPGLIFGRYGDASDEASTPTRPPAAQS